MDTIEFFAWSNEISKYMKSIWHNTFAIDYVNYEWIDFVHNIYTIQKDDLPYIPDFIWASPDCTTYSIAACWTHRNKDRSPKSDYAKQCDIWNKHWINLVIDLLGINKNLKVTIENPRWILRKMEFMKELESKYWFKRHTVWYCQYWVNIPKPTDIWTNIYNWIPRKECHNYKYDKEWNIIDKHCHHESARRWSSTWTQWKKNAHERSKIPFQLYEEILTCI